MKNSTRSLLHHIDYRSSSVGTLDKPRNKSVLTVEPVAGFASLGIQGGAEIAHSNRAVGDLCELGGATALRRIRTVRPRRWPTNP